MAACSCEKTPPPQAEDPRGPVELRAFLDKAVATTGDELTYTIEIDRHKDIAVELSEPGAEIAGLRIVDSRRPPPETNADRVTERRIYKLRADLVGSYVLPEVRASYLPQKSDDTQTPQEEPVALSTSRIFLEVKSVLPKDGSATDIREIKALKEPDLDDNIYFWSAIGAAAILLAAGLFIWLKQRRKMDQTTPEAPPHQTALEALDALRNLNLDDPESVRRFYFLISEIVRQYTERRFSLNATDLTTNEILSRAVSITELTEEPHRLLKDFLQHTDMVKFAELKPTETQIQTCYDQAVRYIELTTPETPQPDEHNDRRAA